MRSLAARSYGYVGGPFDLRLRNPQLDASYFCHLILRPVIYPGLQVLQGPAPAEQAADDCSKRDDMLSCASIYESRQALNC